MKRYFSFLLVFVFAIFMCTTAFADGFTLRNGILFGDKMEDILAKETKLVRESEDSNWFKGTIAGYSGAKCGFYFDDDGIMYAMDYSFDSDVCTSRDRVNDVYKTLYDSVVRQYGKPLGNTGGTVHLITGPAIDKMAMWVYLLGALDGNKGDYYDYDEWTLNYDEYHVKIDLISYYYRDSDYNYSYYVDLSYKKYTDEDFDAALKEKQGEREEVDSDI